MKKEPHRMLWSRSKSIERLSGETSVVTPMPYGPVNQPASPICRKLSDHLVGPDVSWKVGTKWVIHKLVSTNSRSVDPTLATFVRVPGHRDARRCFCLYTKTADECSCNAVDFLRELMFLSEYTKPYPNPAFFDRPAFSAEGFK